MINSTKFDEIILNQTDRKKNSKIFSPFFFSCLVRLLKEWMDQNAKKRMSDSRGRQRRKRETMVLWEKKDEEGATEQIIAIMYS